MTLSVVGVGLGRTGTMSLKRALEVLLEAPCHHMIETLGRPQDDRIWLGALEGAPTDWDALYEGYCAAVGWPTVHFWRDVLAHYPDAKAVLTLRDPDSWYESFADTVYPVVSSDADPDGEASPEHRAMTRQVVLEGTFGTRFTDRAYALQCYADHVEQVRQSVPKGRLLEYDVAEGWAPLCAFLDVPEPDAPFPHVNTRTEFRLRHVEGEHDPARPAGE